MTTPSAGDSVMVARAFVRSCGMYTGPVPFARGVICDVRGLVAYVNWDTAGMPKKILVANLVKTSERHLEAI